jgi:uncharacterized protein
VSKHWIQTFSGKQFYPVDPDPAAFSIRDQARALSMLCRYVGHVDRFYSVAEHAVRVSRLAGELAERNGYPLDSWTGLEWQRWGLIHDNSEAYTGDMSLPLKSHPALAGFRELEHQLQTKIAVWLGLPEHEPALVAVADELLMGIEARALKSPVHPEWELPRLVPGKHDLGWTPAWAEATYLRRFKRLWGKDARRYL